MQAGKSQRSVLALVITCALILGFGIPLIPLVGVDSAEGTEVSAASDVATVSAENSLQNGSFEQPDVYQYRETSDVPYWKSTTTSGNIEIGSVFKNGNGDNDSLRMRTGEKVAAAEGSQFGKRHVERQRPVRRTELQPGELAVPGGQHRARIEIRLGPVPPRQAGQGRHGAGGRPETERGPHEDVRHQQRPAASPKP